MDDKPTPHKRPTERGLWQSSTSVSFTAESLASVLMATSWIRNMASSDLPFAVDIISEWTRRGFLTDGFVKTIAPIVADVPPFIKLLDTLRSKQLDARPANYYTNLEQIKYIEAYDAQIRRRKDRRDDLKDRRDSFKDRMKDIRRAAAMQENLLEPQLGSLMGADLLEPQPASLMGADLLEPQLWSLMEADLLEPQPASLIGADLLEPQPASLTGADLLGNLRNRRDAAGGVGHHVQVIRSAHAPRHRRPPVLGRLHRAGRQGVAGMGVRNRCWAARDVLELQPAPLTREDLLKSQSLTQEELIKLYSWSLLGERILESQSPIQKELLKSKLRSLMREKQFKSQSLIQEELIKLQSWSLLGEELLVSQSLIRKELLKSNLWSLIREQLFKSQSLIQAELIEFHFWSFLGEKLFESQPLIREELLELELRLFMQEDLLEPQPWWVMRENLLEPQLKSLIPENLLGPQPRSLMRGRMFEVKGSLNGSKVVANADTGAGQNLISEKMVRSMNLEPLPDTGDELLLPTGRTVSSRGQVEMQFQFDGEDKKHNIRCAILPEMTHDLVLGGSFLKTTETLTRYKHRLTKVFSSPSRLSLNLVGKEQDFLGGYLNGHECFAIPDTGSDVMLISEAYARKRGLKIHRGARYRSKIQCIDGSEKLTGGLVYANWQFRHGEDPVECTFHVLRGLPVDAILNNALIDEFDVFSQYEDRIGSPESLMLNNQESHAPGIFGISLVERCREEIRSLSESFQEDLHCPNPFTREMVERERARRDEIRDKIAQIPIQSMRTDEERKEYERQRRWDDLWKSHREATNGIGPPLSGSPGTNQGTLAGMSDASTSGSLPTQNHSCQLVQVVVDDGNSPGNSSSQNQGTRWSRFGLKSLRDLLRP